INSAASIEDLVQTVTHTARDVIGAHEAITLYLGEHGSGLRSSKPMCIGAYSDKYAEWDSQVPDLGPIWNSPLVQTRKAFRISQDELTRHADWPAICTLNVPPPAGGLLGGPFTRRDGSSLGVLFLSDP